MYEARYGMLRTHVLTTIGAMTLTVTCKSSLGSAFVINPLVMSFIMAGIQKQYNLLL